MISLPLRLAGRRGHNIGIVIEGNLETGEAKYLKQDHPRAVVVIAGWARV
jgi:hypothetical protein